MDENLCTADALSEEISTSHSFLASPDRCCLEDRTPSLVASSLCGSASSLSSSPWNPSSSPPPARILFVSWPPEDYDAGHEDEGARQERLLRSVKPRTDGAEHDAALEESALQADLAEKIARGMAMAIAASQKDAVQTAVVDEIYVETKEDARAAGSMKGFESVGGDDDDDVDTLSSLELSQLLEAKSPSVRSIALELERHELDQSSLQSYVPCDLSVATQNSSEAAQSALRASCLMAEAVADAEEAANRAAVAAVVATSSEEHGANTGWFACWSRNLGHIYYFHPQTGRVTRNEPGGYCDTATVRGNVVTDSSEIVPLDEWESVRPEATPRFCVQNSTMQRMQTLPNFRAKRRVFSRRRYSSMATVGRTYLSACMTFVELQIFILHLSLSYILSAREQNSAGSSVSRRLTKRPI